MDNHNIIISNIASNTLYWVHSSITVIKPYCLHCNLKNKECKPTAYILTYCLELALNCQVIIILLRAFHLIWLESQIYGLHVIYKIINQNLLLTLRSVNSILKTYCLHCNLLFGMGPKPQVCQSVLALQSYCLHFTSTAPKPQVFN